jgi:hypothetical protein
MVHPCPLVDLGTTHYHRSRHKETLAFSSDLRGSPFAAGAVYWLAWQAFLIHLFHAQARTNRWSQPLFGVARPRQF